jgi:hypothetical protein
MAKDVEFHGGKPHVAMSDLLHGFSIFLGVLGTLGIVQAGIAVARCNSRLPQPVAFTDNSASRICSDTL